MKPGVLIPIGILLFLAAGGYFIDRSRAGSQSVLSGYFESQPTEAASRLGGRVTKIFVKEGDAVKAGQALVRLESKSYAATYEADRMATEQARQQFVETAKGPRLEDISKQEAAVREAQADLDKLINGPLAEEIRSSQAKYREARAQYKKMLSGSRPEEIDAARAAANVALEKLREAQRGLTSEEREELHARLQAAEADEELAKKQLDRQRELYQQGAIAKKDYDQAVSTYQQDAAHTKDAAEAYKRAKLGTPPEELGEAREAYLQAQAQYELVKKGSRKEDIEASRQEMVAADQNLRLLLRGSRQEDIRAARAKVDQEKSALLELVRGSRKEDIAKAKAAQDQAALLAKSVADNLKENTVYATRNAAVDRILVADGDLVAAGAPIIQLSYPDDIWLRVYVPDTELRKIRVGDRADLAVDGVAGVTPGLVENIASNGEFTPANLQSPEERGKQVFAIRIRLVNPDRRIKAGMYATVKKVGQWP